ncbi:MAG: metallophosphoesterase family protein [Nitrososphaeria archaeon]|nr:metallophosphoesterase family protein [Nitrososphaeria archaeon]MDW8022017.1 metallophosphoesterase family protein [Nitrososphaerota archaeon]
MRIFQVSDIHENVESAEMIPERARALSADLILIAGDITHFGGISEAEEILGIISRAGLPIFFVSGNCDSRELLTWSPKKLNAINLNGRLEFFSGYSFIGVGGGSGKFGTLTELEEDEFEEVLNRFRVSPESLILLTHSPPHGTEVDFTGAKHIGSTTIRRFIERVQPLLVCTGHAHEGRGIISIGKTVVVNAGPAKNGFCAIIDVDGDFVRPELLTLY